MQLRNRRLDPRQWEGENEAMRIPLIQTIPGDRFIGGTGIAWTVLANDGVSVTVVSAGREPYMNAPPADYFVDVTNRDESLTLGDALSNLSAAGVTGKVIAVEDQRCVHDMIVSQCGICTGRMGDEATSSKKDPVIVAVWEAQYPGRCDWCDCQIEPGDRMGKDEHGSYVCEHHL